MNEKLKLIGAAELAEILGISLASLYRRRSLGDALPPAVRIGSLIRWRVEDIEEYLAANLETSPERGL